MPKLKRKPPKKRTLIVGAVIFVLILIGVGATATLLSRSTDTRSDASEGLGTTTPGADFAGITTRNDNIRLSDNWRALERRVGVMKEMGVSWDRLFLGSAQVIQADGTINEPQLAHIDRLLDTYEENDLQAYILLFNNSSLIGSTVECPKPELNSTPFSLTNSPPRNLELWDLYITTLVRRFGSPGSNQIKYWEISFEPNRVECIFASNPQLYADFVIHTSKLIKRIDPSAKIMLGRLLGNDRYGYLDKMFELGVGPHIDVISLGDPYVCNGYTWIHTIIERMNAVQTRYGYELPIWMTEFTCASDQNEDGISEEVGLAMQAEFVKNIVPNALNAGAEKLFVQSFIDRPHFEVIPQRATGMLTVDLQPKPAFYAYKQAIIDAASIVAPIPTPSPIATPRALPTPKPTQTYIPIEFLNSNFELGNTRGWQRSADISLQHFLVFDNQGAYPSPGSQGRYWLKVVREDDGKAPLDLYVVSDCIALKNPVKGKTYQVRMLLRPHQASVQTPMVLPGVGFQLYPQNNNWSGTYYGSSNISITQLGWREYSHVFTIPSTIVNSTNKFRIVLRPPNTNVPLYIDDVRVDEVR